MEKDPDITNPRYSEHNLQVLSSSLYRGFTVAFYPLKSRITDTIVFQQGEQDFMMDCIKRFKKIQKDTWSGFMLVNCSRDFVKQMN